MDGERRIFSVTDVNEYVRGIVDPDPLLSSLWIRGELSNFTNHRTGHMYMTMKDESGLLKAVMFRSAAQKLLFMPESGMKVVAHGRVSVFVRDGQYVFYIDRMEPDGIGALYLAYKQLRKKLEAEGLFSESRKKPLPKIPTRIGVITSPTGAAVRDIFNILGRRFPYAKVTLFPSLVQGDGAPAQLIEGIEYFNKTRSCDVIIIGRGGGSIEDLWAFNSEALARTVAASDIPVISAVGHETDFTICDFAADRRAPTPSAAAEIAVPETEELKRKISNVTGRTSLSINQKTELYRRRVAELSEKRILKDPVNMLDDRRMAVLSLSQRTEGVMKYRLSEARQSFSSLSQRTESAVKYRISQSRQAFMTLEQKSESALNISLGKMKSGFTASAAKLDALNPLSVISRGYSAICKEDGRLVRSTDDINIGDKFRFRTSDGSITGEVTDKKKA